MESFMEVYKMECKLLKPYKGFTIEKSYKLKADGTIDKTTINYDAYDTEGDYFNGNKNLAQLKKSIDNYTK